MPVPERVAEVVLNAGAATIAALLRCPCDAAAAARRWRQRPQSGDGASRSRRVPRWTSASISPMTPRSSRFPGKGRRAHRGLLSLLRGRSHIRQVAVVQRLRLLGDGAELHAVLAVAQVLTVSRIRRKSFIR